MADIKHVTGKIENGLNKITGRTEQGRTAELHIDMRTNEVKQFIGRHEDLAALTNHLREQNGPEWTQPATEAIIKTPDYLIERSPDGDVNYYRRHPNNDQDRTPINREDVPDELLASAVLEQL